MSRPAPTGAQAFANRGSEAPGEYWTVQATAVETILVASRRITTPQYVTEGFD